MQITLRINNDEEKTYTNGFVKARVFRNALKLNKQLKTMTDISVELFDSLVEFVVIAFDSQFTIDEVWDGVEAHKLQAEVMRVFNEVLGLGGLAVQGQSDEGNGQGK
ncbi:phage tail assembly chaperone G [Anaerobacillus isosaccharinicus]|uniref:Phage protein n=1 Tax=Anaerobacillus isosaccharinicus TaxID=1532552 RepID=A0A1S2L9P0_9BACI|nr:hypothetical protein [Anaerobacillus isosaccharinicus]MBA5584578.1 hypothetical protein [Anaerobacillus isosaccharinicus]QOY37042.1 hypothetical protein AWH56_005195 [Anaerobacillus isosaccharinicus]